MIRIAQPEYGYLFLSILPMAAVLIFHFIWRKKALSKLGEWKLVQLLLPDYSRGRSILKTGLTVAAFISILLGLVNIQSGGAEKMVQHEGSDFVLLMDVSNSMLADDIQPNRLEVAKSAASQILHAFPDSRFALVAFAGSASTLLPLTPDHAAAQMSIASLSSGSADVQGSDIGVALNEAMKALPENQNHYSGIILFTDGEDHEHHINQAMQKIADAGIMVCCVGVGSESGSTIPLDGTGLKNDARGNKVITRPDASVLQSIALKSNGVFTHLLSSTHSSGDIIDRLGDLQKKKFDEKLFVQYESVFQYFLLPALLILMLETFITTRKKSTLN